MLSAHLHSEFGWLCPSMAVRRAAVAMLAFCAVALITNAGSVGALLTHHGPEPAGQGASAPVMTGYGSIAAAAGPAGAAAGDTRAPGIFSAEGVASTKAGSISAATEGSSEARRMAVPAVRAAGPGSRHPERATHIACERSTWAHLDGRCGAGGLRRVRAPERGSQLTAVGGSVVRPGTASGPASSLSPSAAVDRRSVSGAAGASQQMRSRQAAASDRSRSRLGARRDLTRADAQTRRPRQGVLRPGPDPGLFAALLGHPR
jgi:hypothetical protein